MEGSQNLKYVWHPFFLLVLYFSISLLVVNLHTTFEVCNFPEKRYQNVKIGYVISGHAPIVL